MPSNNVTINQEYSIKNNYEIGLTITNLSHDIQSVLFLTINCNNSKGSIITLYNVEWIIFFMQGYSRFNYET